MASTRRQLVDSALATIPPRGRALTSKHTPALFQEWTAWTQTALVGQWRREEIAYLAEKTKYQLIGGAKPRLAHTTTCNAFTGKYSQKIGSAKQVNTFYLDKAFPNAFVVSDPKGTNRPGYGDIVMFVLNKRFHVNVSLDFEGDMWNHVDGGRGGRTTGYDVVQREQTRYQRDMINGWVDISKLPGVSITEGQTVAGAHWLQGWWQVKWRGKYFFYLFERDGQVKFTRTRPKQNTDSLTSPIDTGTYTIDTSVTITWKATGSVEVLKRGANNSSMSGHWNRKENLFAEKL